MGIGIGGLPLSRCNEAQVKKSTTFIVVTITKASLWMLEPSSPSKQPKSWKGRTTNKMDLAADPSSYAS